MGLATRHRRSFSSQQPTRRPAGRRPARKVVTLDPLQFSTMGQQVYDLSGFGSPNLHTPKKAVFRPSCKHGGASLYWRAAFPPGTKGVFYYHLAPGSPPQAGEVRFKKCDSVQQFSSGEDLQADAGQPWALSLLHIVQARIRKGVLDELLVEPGLVDRELVADLQRLLRDCTVEKRLISHATTLCDIDQSFVVDLDTISFIFRLVTRQSLHIVRFCIWRTVSLQQPPFYGRVRARFELGNYRGRISIHLRILDIIKPIERRFEQDLMAEPRAGELLMRGPYGISQMSRGRKSQVRCLKRGAAIISPWEALPLLLFSHSICFTSSSVIEQSPFSFMKIDIYYEAVPER
ncbi:hypothetical protein M413DRAFT_445319 [Hebeloma cylindrosporum]|uniref:Uncharacterized protein n=1 Tax=Hebeloma cylindrosporum TaxID=76867 RepID=A0A0C3CCE5_HEBCY|nr:hypothetical protein M413DRAFT_445319 [Hebeloma cylindrosporum h7]